MCCQIEHRRTGVIFQPNTQTHADLGRRNPPADHSMRKPVAIALRSARPAQAIIQVQPGNRQLGCRVLSMADDNPRHECTTHQTTNQNTNNRYQQVLTVTYKANDLIVPQKHMCNANVSGRYEQNAWQSNPGLQSKHQTAQKQRPRTALCQRAGN